MKRITSLGLSILILFIVSCKEKDEETSTDQNNPTAEVITIRTDFGEMVVWLYPETPVHRHNFIHLADSGFYDSTEFHRNVTNFVIQGGDPLSKDDDRLNDGTGGPGYTLTAEIDSARFKHKYGAIGAARTGNATNPERRSSGSQFYICVNPNGSPHLDGEYTVFGEVISGMNVAEEIVAQPKNSKGLPNERIKMSMKVTKLTAEQIKNKFGFEVKL